MMYKTYSDSYLKTMTKESIIRQLRCAEHNMYSAEKTLEQQVENTKDWVPVVHGKWIDKSEDDINVLFRNCPNLRVMSRRCSFCERISYDLYDYGGYKEKKYCGRCGARMDLTDIDVGNKKNCDSDG